MDGVYLPYWLHSQAGDPCDPVVHHFNKSTNRRTRDARADAGYYFADLIITNRHNPRFLFKTISNLASSTPSAAPASCIEDCECFLTFFTDMIYDIQSKIMPPAPFPTSLLWMFTLLRVTTLCYMQTVGTTPFWCFQRSTCHHRPNTRLCDWVGLSCSALNWFSSYQIVCGLNWWVRLFLRCSAMWGSTGVSFQSHIVFPVCASLGPDHYPLWWHLLLLCGWHSAVCIF